MARLHTAAVPHHTEPPGARAPYLIVLDSLSDDEMQSLEDVDLTGGNKPAGCVGLLVLPFPVEVL